MGTGSVRQRSHLLPLTSSFKLDDILDGGGSPARKFVFESRTIGHQSSRSPRTLTKLGNPYALQQRSSFSLLVYVFSVATLFFAALQLQTSLDILFVADRGYGSQEKNDDKLHRGDPHQPIVSSYHRVHFLDGSWIRNHQRRKVSVLHDYSKDVNLAQDEWLPFHEERCRPKANWQIHSKPNCNIIHEINIAYSSGVHNTEESLSILGEGWFRTTWRLHRLVTEDDVVLKTLRIEREFLSEYYELHRRDAVAMERLTASPFVVNIFGYCGNSAINELANFPFPDILNLESFNRRMRGKNSAHANAIKLRMAASIALGVADIHAGGALEANDENVYIAHYDLNPRNIALFAGGRPKINDFNIAEFLRYDPATNRTCKFPSRLHEPWWRAPEEMNTTHVITVDEKVDIYALGNILYHTLTTHSGYGKQKKERMPTVRTLVAAGIQPPIPELYRNSTDPNVIAILEAIDLCWEKDSEKRSTAEEVAAILYEALLKIREEPLSIADKELRIEGAPKIENDNVDDSADGSEIENKDPLRNKV